MNIAERINDLINQPIIESTEYDLTRNMTFGEFESLGKRRVKKFAQKAQDIIDSMFTRFRRSSGGRRGYEALYKNMISDIHSVWYNMFEDEIESLYDDWDGRLAEQLSMMRFQALEVFYEYANDKTQEAFERARDNGEDAMADEYWDAQEAVHVIYKDMMKKRKMEDIM